MPTEAQININRLNGRGPDPLTHRFRNPNPPWQLNHLHRRLGSFHKVLLHPGNSRGTELFCRRQT